MAAAPATCDEFLDLLRKSGVIPAKTLDDLDDLPGEPTACAAVLVAKGHITKFQAKLLLNGRWKGFKLGPYVVREQIGQGGMGAVFLAVHETLQRKVALKVLTPPTESKEAPLALERFLREARSAAALDHPNIVRLHDVGQNGNTHYLVMEYVEGQTLEQLMGKAGPLAPGRAAGYIAQAAAGLQHAHEKGFVHRDIKPANLMLAKDGMIKILDMGLARPTEDTSKLTQIMDNGAIVGTADFISPEQAMNNPVDIRSDIYSLGASFFALVTGAPPFTGSTTQKLIQHQMKSAPTLRELDKTFPHGLSEVVAQMLEKRPENRFQTPAELIAALTAWLPENETKKVTARLSAPATAELENTLSEIESATRRFGTSTRLGVRKAKQKQMMIGFGVAAAVLVVGGLVGFFALGGKKDPPVVDRKSDSLELPPIKKETPKDVAKETAKETPKEPVKPTQVMPKTPPSHLVMLQTNHILPFTMKLAREGTQKETYIGDGRLPNMWYKWVETSGSTAEIVGEEFDGRKCIALRMTGGSGGFSLNAPEFTVPPSGRVMVELTYRTEAKSPGASVRLRAMKPADKTTTVITLPATGGAWKTISKEVDAKSATSVLFELSTTGQGDDGTIRFSQFDVTPISGS